MGQLQGVGYSRIELWNAAGDSLIDYIEFDKLAQEDVWGDFIPERDCPDKELDNGDIKRYTQGTRVLIEIKYRASDYIALTSNLGRTIQEFIIDIHNSTGVIKVKPHMDKSFIYEVLLQNAFKPSKAFGKWLGWDGMLIFRGSKRLSSIDIAP